MKTFLVSGAGSGIGRAIANKLASEDQKVILLGRRDARLKQTKDELQNPDRHPIIRADVRDKNAIGNGLKAAGLTHLDGVVANAGVGGENTYGPKDRWDEIISINLTGTYLLVKECLPYLKKQPERFKHIIIISSILARLGIPNYSAYCASKAGLLGLMRSLAAQYARNKILVNAICPGWVETDMARQGIQAYADAVNKSYDQAFEEQMSMVPLQKMSQPEEVANLVCFLLSEEQTSFTGQTFDINNGALMPC